VGRNLSERADLKTGTDSRSLCCGGGLFFATASPPSRYNEARAPSKHTHTPPSPWRSCLELLRVAAFRHRRTSSGDECALADEKSLAVKMRRARVASRSAECSMPLSLSHSSTWFGDNSFMAWRAKKRFSDSTFKFGLPNIPSSISLLRALARVTTAHVLPTFFPQKTFLEDVDEGREGLVLCKCR